MLSPAPAPIQCQIVLTLADSSLAHARPIKNNGLVKLVYQTCVGDVSKYLKHFIEFTCGKIKKGARIIITVWLM